MWYDQLKPEEQITAAQVLQDGDYIQIAAVHEGLPYLVAMNYGWEEGKIYLHGGNTPGKSNALSHQKTVVFQVITGTQVIPREQPCAWSCHFASVMGEGFVERLTGEEARHGLTVLMSHYDPTQNTFTFEDKIVDRTCVWVIHVEKLSLKVKNDPLS